MDMLSTMAMHKLNEMTAHRPSTSNKPSTVIKYETLSDLRTKFHEHLSTIPEGFRPSTISAYENISTSTFAVEKKHSTIHFHFSTLRMSHSTILIEKNIEERKIFFSKKSDDDYYERLSSLTAAHMVKFYELQKQREQGEAELLILNRVKAHLEAQVKTL